MTTRAFLLAMLGYVSAQVSNSNFNQVINLNGDMNLNSITFPDGSKIEAFSQTQRQLLVNQNQSPLPGNQVTGSTGNPFVSLNTNSLVIQTNGATDLVGGQIELAMNQQQLQSNNINRDNTYVAKLSPDRQSWMIMETIKSVNSTDNTVRLVKMNSIDGEYIVLGRQTTETSLALTPFGSSPQSAFNITGSGIQENEFIDGFRMSVKSTEPMVVNTNVNNGISSTMLSALGSGTQSINNYRYLVTTNLGGVVPSINRMVAVVQLPINPIRLQTVANNLGVAPNGNIRLSIAQRGILNNPGGAQGTTGGLRRRQDNQTQSQDQNQNQNSGNQNQNSGNQNQNSGNQNQNSGNQNQNSGNQNQNSGNQNQNSGTNTGNSNNPAATRLLLSPTFTAIPANAVLDQMNGRLAIPVMQVDGEYIITVSSADGVNSPNSNNPQQPAPQQPSPQQPSPQQPSPQQPSPQQPSPQQPSPQQPSPQQPSPQQPSPQQPSPQQPSAQQPSPQVSAPQQPAPQGSQTPGGAQPVGQTSPLAAAPASASTPIGLAPPAAVSAVSAPLAASPAPAPVFRGRARRQLVAPAAPVPAAAPAPASAPVSNGVVVNMAWVNELARIQTEGLPINVGAMMSEFVSQNEAAQDASVPSFGVI